MIILVLNCGSSSIKYQVIDMCEKDKLLAKGIVERIGITDGILTHKPEGKDRYEVVKDIPDHTVGINLILEALVDKTHGVINSLNEISAVGHRVAHGGEFFTESSFIDEKVKIEIEKCIELAPLHNPANLKGILSMENLLPGVPQVAVFDTSFHQSIPKHAFMYGIPYEYYENFKIRKYGFHGTSHKYVAKKACKLAGMDFEKSKIITCHLGNGASIAAIKNGKSVDTSMGFTPVDGLLMGTRCGNIDPGVLLYIAERENLNFKGISDLINKRSGVAGVSGLSSDMRDLENAAAEGHEGAKLALDMYDYRVTQYIGSYAAVMGGVDLIVFTGGIGENDSVLRHEVCTSLSFMGVDFDIEGNKGVRGKDKLLTKPDSKVKVMVITTNEELVIASDTAAIVGKMKKE
ncbi:MAG TPA: acetate kinase [Tenuifilaceae bacterium]|nr:acetate kinase [Tenuifilaceae bacterium]HPE18395.1 acetate kinase [Tenuifilaceae bacterium]HPJ45912.1 acetate kinase [Tenuifilaceae bacterium]HPQ34527.1 acetate kinase [Tenuifilaceae bacterium]HRX68251.1 acetate kinase [Tenuifilaceae bacterium]